MRIVICESAENHPDGTYSMKRGGIDRWTADLPAAFSISLLIETTADEVPHGRVHPLLVTLSGVIQGEMVGEAGAGDGELSRMVLPVQGVIEKFGTLRFDVEINGVKASAAIAFIPETKSEPS